MDKRWDFKSTGQKAHWQTRAMAKLGLVASHAQLPTIESHRKLVISRLS